MCTGLGQGVLTAVLMVNAFRDEPSIALIFVVAGLLTWAESLPPPKPARKRVRKAPSARRPGSAAKPRRSKAEAAPQALLPAPDKKG